MSATPNRLGTWDYVTCVVMIILASCIAIYHIISSRKSKNIKDFLVKSNELGILPLILSTAATNLSAVGLLGYPTETYTNGVSFLVICLSYCLSIPLGLYLYLPVFYNLGVNSIFQYLEFRFNRGTRLLASIIINIQLVLYTSCTMYAPALALNQVTGLHLWASVSMIGFVCIVYTALGGIKAVVWTDVTQCIVMTVVIIIILVKGTVDLGGIAEIWRVCTEGKRSQFFIFENSPFSTYSFWAMMLGGGLHYLGMFTTNQLMVQRYLCNRTLKDAKISFFGGAIMINFIVAVAGACGLIMYARYHDCDPLINGQVTSRDQIMALFSMETLGFCEGLPGIFVAGILCATLSTLSSSINSLSTITMEDYIKPFNTSMSDATQLRLSKIIAFVYGIVCIALVLVVQNIDGLIRALFTLNGITGGPVLAIFTIGMALPWVNSWGALSGFFAGILLSGWAGIGNLIFNPKMPHAPYDISGCNISELSLFNQSGVFVNSTGFSSMLRFPEPVTEIDIFPLYSVPSIWYTSWSCSIGLVVATVISILTGPRKYEDIDHKLLFPLTNILNKKLHKEYKAVSVHDKEEKDHPKELSTEGING